MNRLIFVLTVAMLVVVAECGSFSSKDKFAVKFTDLKISTGSAPGSVEIADFNGDGNGDIVVANEQSGNATVLLGDGKGKFVPSKGSPFAVGQLPNDIAVGDFNRDGKPDLAFANHEQKHMTILLGDGQGGFAPAPKSPFAVESRPHVHGVTAADYNGDGNFDLATDSWADEQVILLFGDGKGDFKSSVTFLKVGKRPYQRLRSADVNGDKYPDIITTNMEGNDVSVLLGDGKGGFKSADSTFACGDSPFNFAIGDVNKDGKSDLAIVNSPGSTAEGRGKDGLTVLLGDGDGNFATLTGSPFAAGRQPNRVAIGDVNGDGVNDIAVSNPDENKLRVFLMKAKNGIASSLVLSINGNPKGVAISDLNGDRKADIVITNNGENIVTVMFSK